MALAAAANSGLPGTHIGLVSAGYSNATRRVGSGAGASTSATSSTLIAFFIGTNDPGDEADDPP